MKIQDFVVLDLETTGLSVKEDQILEIGAVKVQGGEVTASYETFVNPGRKVPERITELTGIRDEMIANAPDVETAVRGFLDFCGGLPRGVGSNSRTSGRFWGTIFCSITASSSRQR